MELFRYLVDTKLDKIQLFTFFNVCHPEVLKHKQTCQFITKQFISYTIYYFNICEIICCVID
jgi:hypothetical protein